MSNPMTIISKAIRRALIGLIVGLLVGSVVVAIDQMRFEAATSVTVLNLPIVALIFGGVIGMPAGVIIGVLSGMADYKSGWGIEWAVVGVLAAPLTIGIEGAVIGQLGSLVIILAVTGALAERSASVLLKDKGQNKIVPLKTLMIYVIGVLSIAIVIRIVLGLIASIID